MAFEKLTQQEQEMIRQSMSAILDGPFIDDVEFQTRLGIDRKQLREVLAAWPWLEDADDSSNAVIAINNCLNEVLHGVYVNSKDWARWFTTSKEDIKAVYERWAEQKGYHSTGIS